MPVCTVCIGLWHVWLSSQQLSFEFNSIVWYGNKKLWYQSSRCAKASCFFTTLTGDACYWLPPHRLPVHSLRWPLNDVSPFYFLFIGYRGSQLKALARVQVFIGDTQWADTQNATYTYKIQPIQVCCQNWWVMKACQFHLTVNFNLELPEGKINTWKHCI